MKSSVLFHVMHSCYGKYSADYIVLLWHGEWTGFATARAKFTMKQIATHSAHYRRILIFNSTLTVAVAAQGHVHMQTMNNVIVRRVPAMHKQTVDASAIICSSKVRSKLQFDDVCTF